VHDSASDDLAQGRADTDRRADRSQREIESARAPRQIGDHEDRHYTKDACPYAVRDLNGNEQYRVGCERVKNPTNRQYAESD
jgi:hypothetical protein